MSTNSIPVSYTGFRSTANAVGAYIKDWKLAAKISNEIVLGKELLVGSSFFFCAIFLAVCCKVNILESQNGLKLFGFSIFSPTYKKEEYVCIQQKLRL